MIDDKKKMLPVGFGCGSHITKHFSSLKVTNVSINIQDTDIPFVLGTLKKIA